MSFFAFSWEIMRYPFFLSPKRHAAQVWPIVQSLAELVHHAPTVVDMLLALLEDPAVVAQVNEYDLLVIFRALCIRRRDEAP